MALNKTGKSSFAMEEKNYEPQVKENKKKHVHILTQESLIERMDAYAAQRGVSRTAVFEAAITAFLDKVEV